MGVGEGCFYFVGLSHDDEESKMTTAMTTITVMYVGFSVIVTASTMS